MTDEANVSFMEDILGALTDRGVRFVVAGGVAAVLHGVERTTMDIDISLDLSAQNVARFGEAMDALGLKPLVPVPVEALSDPELVRVMVEEKNAIVFMLADPAMPLRKVDVFLAPSLRYENLVQDAITVEISDMQLKVASMKRLLELKRAVDPPREKDVFDIQAIERLLEREDGDD